MQITWATPIFLLALYGLVRFLARPSVEQSEKQRPGWTPLESIGITLLIYFASQLFVGLTLYLVPSALGLNDSQITYWLESAVGQFVAVLSIDAMSLVLLLSFLKRRHATLKTIGFIGKPAWRDIGYALAGFGVYFVSYIVLSIGIKALLPSINFEQEQQLGFKDVSNIQLPLVFLSLVVLPPLIEELLTRGFLYTGLKAKLPRIPAMLLTSILFAVAHLQFGSNAPLLWVAAIDTFILSLVLIILKDKTKRLWAPILLHALKNGIAFTALFIFHVQ